MMDHELPHGFSLQESHASVTYANVSTEVLEHSVEYLPAPGFIAIEDFMPHHLNSYDNFIAAILKTHVALNFQQAKPSKA